MKSTLVLCLMHIISLLPLCIARFFGQVTGELMVAFKTQPFRVTQRNLSLCFPHQSKQANETLARHRMRHLGQTFLETPVLWRRSSQWREKRIIAIEGESFLQEALANEKGTILLIPHQGSWEFLNLWLATQSTITSLYQPPKMATLANWMKHCREKTGANLVPTNVSGVAALLKTLKKGKSVVILPDQQPPKTSGDFAPLFGIQALTMTLTHNLLKRSDSQAIFGCALREPGGWRLHFSPADPSIYSADQGLSLQAMNAGIESVATLAPTQYQWEYKRFRARPEGYPPIYSAGS